MGETAGIPSTFNFRRESDKDWQGITLIGRKEIDLIIATIQADSGKLKSFMSIPLWVPAGDGTLRKLKTMGTDKELEVVLSEGTEFATDISKTNDDFVGDNAEAAFDENWAITWKDFKPYDDYHTYAMKWLSDSIEWYAGQKDMAALRITLNKKTDGDSLFPTMESLP